ncbi:MAG: hypothetical protein OXG60_08600 [Chloroflexi bacterium]|nr:hypothetical protein [Chloroflexota bacterium]
MKMIAVFGSSQARPENHLNDTAVDIGAGLAQAAYKIMTSEYKDDVFIFCGKSLPGRCSGEGQSGRLGLSPKQLYTLE